MRYFAWSGFKRRCAHVKRLRLGMQATNPPDSINHGAKAGSGELKLTWPSSVSADRRGLCSSCL